MTSLVRANNVTKAYGDLRAVDNVSFEIEKGRIAGLIGPNGAGKTTLLKAVLGLTDFEGNLSVLGLDPFRQRKKLMENICFIADVAVLPRWMRVSQLLDFIEVVHPRFSRRRAEELLGRTQVRAAPVDNHRYRRAAADPRRADAGARHHLPQGILFEPAQRLFRR